MKYILDISRTSWNLVRLCHRLRSLSNRSQLQVWYRHLILISEGQVLLRVLPSWPRTFGNSAGIVPSMRERSVWQIPVASIWTRASLGWMASRWIVSSIGFPFNSFTTRASVVVDMVGSGIVELLDTQSWVESLSWLCSWSSKHVLDVSLYFITPLHDDPVVLNGSFTLSYQPSRHTEGVHSGFQTCPYPMQWIPVLHTLNLGASRIAFKLHISFHITYRKPVRWIHIWSCRNHLSTDGRDW